MPKSGPSSRAPTPLAAIVVAALAGVLTGCASPPMAERDGPMAQLPADLPADPASVADAEPQVEAARSGGPNKPYQVLGRDYVPMTGDVVFKERGLASWYGRKFHGRRTASGEVYDMFAMTAAHPTLPIPSYARIRNPTNGREALVRINDRGPFHAGRIVDLSYAAAFKLGLLRGVAPVELERITQDDIRAGAWRRPGSDGGARLAVLPAAGGAELASVAAAPVDLAAGGAALLGAGTAAPAPMPAPAPTQPGFWLQLGAFRERAGAEDLQRRVGSELDFLSARLATFADAAWHRVQAGPFASRADAEAAGRRIRDALGLAPRVVERR